MLEWSTLSVELNFTTIAVLLAKLADFSCSIMAYVVTLVTLLAVALLLNVVVQIFSKNLY